MSQLRAKNIDGKLCLTVRELKAYLNHFQDSDPIILNCGRKNYRFSQLNTVDKKPVLVGKRSARD
jgi:hypothetical protein